MDKGKIIALEDTPKAGFIRGPRGKIYEFIEKSLHGVKFSALEKGDSVEFKAGPMSQATMVTTPEGTVRAAMTPNAWKFGEVISANVDTKRGFIEARDGRLLVSFIAAVVKNWNGKFADLRGRDVQYKDKQGPVTRVANPVFVLPND